jgi:replicative DNA helicase
MNPKNNGISSSNPDFLGKLPPQAVDLERAVLAGVIAEKGIFDSISFLLPEAFYSPAHCLIFEAVLSLHKSHKPIDLWLVTEELRKRGKLEEAGGVTYLAEITQKVASGAHVVNHAKAIFEKHVARELVKVGTEIAGMGFDEDVDITDRIAEAESRLGAITSLAAGGSNMNHIRLLVSESIEQAHRRAEYTTHNQLMGISTGLADLNSLTNGWQKSNLIILAARPGMGKTAIMLHFAKSAAKHGSHAVIFSLEMSSVKQADRLLLSEAAVEPSRFRSGYMSKSELQGLEVAAASLEQLPIYIDDAPEATITQIRAKARLLKKQGKCDMVFIDYLGLIKEKGLKNRLREQEIAAISREAKVMAKELDIPVMLLSQLNRAVEERRDKKPQLADLRESGAIEQDADVVMLIYRPEYYGIEVANQNGNPEKCYGELLIEKNRDGATGTVRFRHNEGLTLVYDYDRSRAMDAFSDF